MRSPAQKAPHFKYKYLEFWGVLRSPNFALPKLLKSDFLMSCFWASGKMWRNVAEPLRFRGGEI